MGILSSVFVVFLCVCIFVFFVEIVDTVLEEDDLDDDGYLTYAEYVFARKREEAREKSEKLREQKKQGRT